jgi:hypothetical protein
MIETFGMTGMLLLAFLVLAAVYILMRLLKGYEGRNEGEGEEGEVESLPKAMPTGRPPTMTDEEFMDFYTGPMLEDGMESLGSGVDSVKSGLHFYDLKNWEVASGDFHSAVRKIDEASNRFKEVPGLVEDESLKPVVEAKASIDQCRLLRALAIRMEEASDAMAEGKEAEAKQHAMVKKELEQMVSDFEAEK